MKVKIFEQAQQAAQITKANRVNRVNGSFDLNMAYAMNGNVKGPDKATVSQYAQEIHKVADVVNQLPDTREDKIAQIQAKIKAGNYAVPVTEIAESIFRLSNEERGI